MLASLPLGRLPGPSGPPAVLAASAQTLSSGWSLSQQGTLGRQQREAPTTQSCLEAGGAAKER